jgi:Mg/Co/Ni transporter MgtE
MGGVKMDRKAIKPEIPFQKLLSVIDQLDPDEKLVLKKKLEKQKVTTWQKRFEKTLDQLGKKNIGFSEKEVAEDVKKAIAEVRVSAKN